MVKGTQILLLIGMAGTFIFLAASCGGNEWSKASITFYDNTYKVTNGLWHYCFEAQNFNWKECNKFEKKLPIRLKSGTDEFPGWLRTVRAFSLLAVLACVGGSIMALLTLVTDKVKGLHVSIFLFGAAGCAIIALATYTDKFIIPERFYAGWSYIFGWIGAIGSGIIGIICLRNSDSSPQYHSFI